MPSVRRVSAPPLLRKARAPLARNPAAAVVPGLLLAAAMAVSGCEYTFDEGFDRPDAEAEQSLAPGPAFTRDPARDHGLRRDPVDEAGLQAWVDRTLPETAQPAIHAGAGLLDAAETRTEATPALAAGTYALGLACRSQRRVTFTVTSGAATLVELGLRCGTNRENVVSLPAESVLTIRVEARTGANYAYRLRRL